jgi:hypothetical protein
MVRNKEFPDLFSNGKLSGPGGTARSMMENWAAQTGGHHARGGALTGAGPLTTPGHGSSQAGAKKGGEHRGPFAGLTRAREAVWQWGDCDEVAVEEKPSGSSAQARREGKKRRGRCGKKRRGSPPFIGAGGQCREAVPGGNGRHFRGLTPLKSGLGGAIKTRE